VAMDAEAVREGLPEEDGVAVVRFEVAVPSGEVVPAREVVAVTVELLLGATVTLELRDAMPEREGAMDGDWGPERLPPSDAEPEREGDEDTEGLKDPLRERLLVTVGEHVGLNCRERKLQDSGQLHAVGTTEPAGQKKPLGQAMALPTLLGQ